MNKPDFFIVGCPRSGTTLLASLLDRHSKICIPPETHFFIEVLPNDWKKYEGDYDQLMNLLFSSLRIKDLEMDKKIFSLKFKKEFQSTFKDLFECMVEDYKINNDKIYFGEKTPNHLNKLENIFEFWPEVKIILLVRDGRDVVLSLKEVPWMHDDIRRLCYYWNEKIEVGNNAKEKWPNNILLVRYEDLVEYTESELRRIASFLNVDFELRQLDVTQKTNVAPQWEKNWKKNIEMKPDPQKILGWMKKSTVEERCIMNFIMRESLKKEGYALYAEKCTIYQSMKNFFFDIVLNTKIKTLLLPIKRELRKLGFKFSKTTPRIDLESYMSGQNYEQN